MTAAQSTVPISISQCTHLIIVCCHAIYLGGPTHGRCEDEWLIEPFQRGETPTFAAHARMGVELMAGDPFSILIFSGGATKRARTNLSEGESYLNLANDNSFFPLANNDIVARVMAETHATDSYQNVLFSLLRFRQATGSYPQRITVVTHAFKRRRFVECHFPALGVIPSSEEGTKATVVGIDPPEEVTPRASLVAGEEKSGIGLWRRDRYGVGTELARKRVQRGWEPGIEEELFVHVGLETVVEELVRWDGGENGNELFPKREQLPW